MNNYRKISELNDTKCGVLATNGQRYRNSNPVALTKYGDVAQLAELPALNREVAGSTPVIPTKETQNRTLKIPYLNHAYDQLDEQSVPALRGMGHFQYDPARIPAGENCCRPVMTGGKTETVNKRSCRRTVRIKSYSPSGRNNRRPD